MICTMLQVTRADIYLLRRSVEILRERLAGAKRDVSLAESEVALAAVCEHASDLAQRLWDADAVLSEGQRAEREAVANGSPY